MLSFIKRTILFSFIFLTSLLGFSQTDVYFPGSAGYDWQQVGSSCNGCPSFLVGVQKTGPNEYGNYKYSIYYLSNSFDGYGNTRMTYISPIYYYFDGGGYWTNNDTQAYWVLCGPKEAYHSYNFWSTSPNLRIKISISGYEYR